VIEALKNGVSALELTRGQLKAVGAVLFIFGVAQFGLSYLVVEKIVVQRKEAASHAAEPVTTCRRKLKDAGYHLEEDGNVFTVSRSVSADGKSLQDATLRLGEASAVALMCPGWRMTGFCLGDGCKNPESVRLELTLAKKLVPKAKEEAKGSVKAN
jgi:hypothetical protein